MKWTAAARPKRVAARHEAEAAEGPKQGRPGVRGTPLRVVARQARREAEAVAMPKWVPGPA
ncbi:hypothetical protein SAMN05421869_1401 [Nonomuraea jiangxiensis]|uniref:Uncharacterized protein n=1 Tax=Nonomuraea jiangxiensis TaxID=633440 RepID=A0A1G9RZN9_9ACTN|nr:hypothetical protein SAMN05421869_1401 [Nonomuraea jiangxiensis]